MKKYNYPEMDIRSFNDENIVTLSANSESVPIDTMGEASQYGKVYNVDYQNLEALF